MNKAVTITKEMILSMCGVIIEAAKFEPIHKEKFLVVDNELFGKVEFPISMSLGRGQKIKFPGYGEVQILEATVDLLSCTQNINEGLYDEYRNNPPEPDPTPAIKPPRVKFAPASLLPADSDGSLESVRAELAKSDVQSGCSLPGRDASLNRLPKDAVPCPHPVDERDQSATGTSTGRSGGNDPSSPTSTRFL